MNICIRGNEKKRAKEAETIIDQVKVGTNDGSVAWNIKQRQKIEKLMIKTRRKAETNNIRSTLKMKEFSSNIQCEFLFRRKLFLVGPT